MGEEEEGRERREGKGKKGEEKFKRQFMLASGADKRAGFMASHWEVEVELGDCCFARVQKLTYRVLWVEHAVLPAMRQCFLRNAFPIAVLQVQAFWKHNGIISLVGPADTIGETTKEPTVTPTTDDTSRPLGIGSISVLRGA